MKKILSLMLTALMILSTMSLAVAAGEALVPTDIYAGISTITLEYDVDAVALENVGTVTITNEQNEVVTNTVTVKDNLAIITPAEDFEIGKKYRLKVGNEVSKEFKINKVWEPTFTDSDGDGKVDTVSNINLISKDNKGLIGVTENKEIVVGTDHFMIYPTVDTNKAEYKNASLSYKVIRPRTWGSTVGLFFNAETAPTGYFIQPGSAYGSKLTTFGWANKNNDLTVKRAYKMKDGSTFYEKGGIATTAGASTDKKLTFSAEDNIDVTLTTTGNNFPGTSTKTATVTIGDADKLAALTPYKITVDKMGSNANLVANNSLIDTYITQQEYTANGLTTTAREYGYFVFATLSGSVVMYSDLMLTTTEMKDYVVADLSVEVTANNNLITLTLEGVEDIDLSNINVENYVEISDDVTYSVEAVEGNKIVLKADNFVPNNTYVVTVKEGFGYEGFTLVADVVASVVLTKNSVKNVYAGISTITVEYAENVSLAEIEDVILKDLNGTDLENTITVKDNLAVITPAQDFEIDKKYRLMIGNEVSKEFKINKVWEPTFTDSDSDGKVDTVSNINVISKDNKGLIGVTENKEIVVGTDHFMIYPTVDTNKAEYKNASLSYKVIRPREWGSTLGLFFNAETAPTGYFIQPGSAYGSKLTTFGWANKNNDLTVKRAYKMKDGSTFYEKGGIATTAGASTDKKLTFSTEGNVDVTLTTTGTNFPGTSTKTATVTIGDTDKLAALTPYKITVDKMGSNANLVANNSLIDTYVTQQEYTANGLTTTAREYGYFVLATLSGSVVMYSDLMLTTTEMRDYLVGDLSVKVDSNNNLITLTLEGVEDIDLSNLNVENYIEISDEVTFSVEAIEGNKVILKAGNFVSDNTYVVTVKEGFGYDGLTLAEDVVASVVLTRNSVKNVYAGISTITVEYAENVSLAEIEDVILKDLNGADIENTITVKDNLAVITPAQDFEIDKKYRLMIGNEVSKEFKINKVWEPTFTDSDGDGKVDTVSGIKLFSKDNAGLIGVTENKEIIIQNTGYIYPDIDTNKEEYKNASFTYKVKRPGYNSAVAPLFNVKSAGSGYLFLAMANYGTKADLFGWANHHNFVRVRRAYKIYIDNNTKYEKGVSNAADDTISTDVELKYAAAQNTGEVTLTSTGTNFPGSSTKTATVTMADAEKFASVTPYKLTVDKMGSNANLVTDNKLIDTYITQNEYVANGIASDVAKAPEFGYFVVAAHTTAVVAYSDLMLTTTEMRDFKVEIESVSYLDANGAEINEADIANATTIKGEIALTSYFIGRTKPLKVVIIAYNNEGMTAIDITEAATIKAGESITVEYELTNLSNTTEIKIVAWDSLENMKPYCAYYSK